MFLYSIEVENQVRNILINLPNESDSIEYKITPYNISDSKGRYDLVHDVVALLISKNALNEDRFIIFGVADNSHKDVYKYYPKGLDSIDLMPDDSTYQPFIQKAICPKPRIITGTIIHDRKAFGYICISKSNSEHIYEVADDLHYEDTKGRPRYISKGLSLMRIGATTTVMMNQD